jgi:hypothetical protein
MLLTVKYLFSHISFKFHPYLPRVPFFKKNCKIELISIEVWPSSPSVNKSSPNAGGRPTGGGLTASPVRPPCWSLPAGGDLERGVFFLFQVWSGRNSRSEWEPRSRSRGVAGAVESSGQDSKEQAGPLQGWMVI